MEPIKLDITDVLDLHMFLPKEVPDLLDDYFFECTEKNIFSVRIIHGKGSGTLRRRVHSILHKHAMVEAFYTAPPESGGWGATIVNLKK